VLQVVLFRIDAGRRDVRIREQIQMCVARLFLLPLLLGGRRRLDEARWYFVSCDTIRTGSPVIILVSVRNAMLP